MGLGQAGPPDEVLVKGDLEGPEDELLDKSQKGLRHDLRPHPERDVVWSFKSRAQAGPEAEPCPFFLRPASPVRLSSGEHIVGAFRPLLHDIDGVPYPGFIHQDAIRRLQRSFMPRSGDVFIVSHFPMRGMQRLLVSLIEGRENPWEEGLIDKPHFIEGGASRRGVDNFLTHIASWSGRRVFKTHAFPQLFPCRRPWRRMRRRRISRRLTHGYFDGVAKHGMRPIEHDGNGIPPKIVVLVADPRYAFSLAWEVMCQFGRGYMDVPDYLVAVLEHGLYLWGDYFAHARAWAHEALENPTTVRLFCAEKFASHDPVEVKAACSEVARFLEMPSPDEAIERLVSATFTRPADAAEALAKDCLLPHEAMNGGPLIELVGPRLEAFQEGLMQVSDEVLGKFRMLLGNWAESSHPCLARLAEVVRRGGGSLMPARLSRPLKGESAHAAGQCRPCVFHLRGICKNTASMCAYCHAEGHAKTKRASRAKRVARRSRVYTPSPDGLSS